MPCETDSADECLRLTAQSTLETAFGSFDVFCFAGEGDSREIAALKVGSFEEGQPPLVAIHSECLHGDVFHSLECDCRAQLELSMQLIQEAGVGLLIYMRGHEGRGHGLARKLHIYELMKQGLDTVDACVFLGIDVDVRSYQDAVDILRHFGLTRVRLATNSPRKIEALTRAGIEAIRVPLTTLPTRQNWDYLLSKQTRLGHSLGLKPDEVARRADELPDGGLHLALEEYWRTDRVGALSVVPLKSLANRVWLVLGGDRPYVLKQHLKHGPVSVAIQHQVREQLRTQGLAIPRVMPNQTGGTITLAAGHAYELSEFVPHTPLRYSLMNMTQGQTADAARLLARLHATSLDSLPLDLPRPPIGLPDHKALSLLKRFAQVADDLTADASPEDASRLAVLQMLIDRTAPLREELLSRGTLVFQSLPNTLNHGDFSLTNLLPSALDGHLYLIDWDNMEVRPRIWELQRGLLLICGKGRCNAHLDELDFARARLFLDAYESIYPLSRDERESLPEIMAFILAFYWLHFTLVSILSGDYRILRMVPRTVEQGLWWQSALDGYAAWLRTGR